MIYLIAQRGDFFGRIAQFQEQFPFWVLLLGAAALLGILQIAFSNRNFWLIPLYFMACMFSGNIIQQVDTGTTFLRWWLIFCFSAAAIRGWAYPGLVCSMLGVYSVYLLAAVSWSPNPIWGLQIAVLGTMMFLFASGNISSILNNSEQIKNLILWFLAIAPIFLLNGLIGIGQISGGRYAGAMGEASVLFVITAGLLMPLFLWGSQTLKGPSRFLCLLGFVITSALGLLAGQRSGFFAGIIACVPFVIQFRSKHLVVGLLGVVLAIPTMYAATQIFPDQTEFITQRFFEEDLEGNLSFSTDTTGREQLWRNAFDKIMMNPIIGHGTGADKVSGVGGFHNAYLQEWYNGGLIGLLLFLGASLVALLQTFFLFQDKRLSEENSQIARLLFSWMVVLFLVSFFEAKLQNPSNIMAFTMVIVGVCANRLKDSPSESYPNAIDGEFF